MIRVYSVEWTKDRRFQAKTFPTRAAAYEHARKVLGDLVPTSTVWCYAFEGSAAEALATAHDKPGNWWDDANVARVFKFKPQAKDDVDLDNSERSA